MSESDEDQKWRENYTNPQDIWHFVEDWEKKKRGMSTL